MKLVILKKLLNICIALILNLILLSCSTPVETFDYEIDQYDVNNTQIATMIIIDGSVTNTGLTVEFSYSGIHQGLYGTWYQLMVYQDNQWKEIPYIIDKETVGWNLIAYDMRKTPQYEMNWDWLYGELPEGRYLIIKKVSDFVESGNFTEYYLAAEFIIE